MIPPAVPVYLDVKVQLKGRSATVQRGCSAISNTSLQATFAFCRQLKREDRINAEEQERNC